jgi:hypothetical protein
VCAASELGMLLKQLSNGKYQVCDSIDCCPCCVVSQVGNVGGLLGPWLIGRVVEATGGYAAALQALGLMVAAAGCLSWSFRRWKL